MTTEATSGGRLPLRLIASCAVLVGIAMVQSPGLVVPDTKLDLALAPLDFLQRAAHLWDAEGAFGQLQNQAYGYLWPMGPFFVLGDAIGLEAWVVQRLWLALVLCTAMVGATLLSRTMGVRSDLACLAAGFAYALSPRMLTVLGPISIEAWPSAMAPWVLLPLVIGSRRGSPVRMAALAGLAVAMVGGVNAAATSAVLPVGVIWLLTRSPGRRRRTLMLLWPLFTVLATLWWLVPLVLMGAYSPPFLDFIESASTTTFPTNLFDALRGTSNWVPYVDPTNRAGNDLLRDYWLPLNSTVVLITGLIGMSLRSSRERLFLFVSLVTGLLLVTMGHTGEVQGWLAPQVNDLLDGPLAPLRNVHKFDPVVRLPLVLGLAWALQALADEARSLASDDTWARLNLRILAGIVVFAVAASASPAIAGHVTPSGGFTDVPGYWRKAAAWLGDNQHKRVALMVPGSSFGDYVWGRPQDEPLQSLATEPWAVRNAVPLTPPGNIRMLDAIEERVSQGQGSAGLATYLRRAGVSHLLVRNDLERSGDVPDPVLVHQALEDSPGLRLAATFGPRVGGGALVGDDEGGRTLVSGGWQTRYPALEIWELTDRPHYAVAGPDPSTVVVGGPEDLLDLADLGVIGDQPVTLAVDKPRWPSDSSDPPVILTDGMRAVERNFGRLHDAVSETRAPDDERHLRGTLPDYELDDADRWTTHVAYVGIVGVTASSSQSWANAAGPVVPGRMPYAALDGRPETEWHSARFAESGHWWQVELAEERGPTTVTLRGGGIEEEVVVTAGDWRSSPVVLPPGEPVEVEVPTSFKTLRVSDASGRESTPLILAQVDIDGLRARRLLELPSLPEGAEVPDLIVLRAVADPRTGCARVDGFLRCVPGRAVPSEEPYGFARRIHMPAPATYEPDLRVRGIPGRELDRAILEPFGVDVTVSSTGNPDVRAGAVAMVDGDPATTWTAAPGEIQPTIKLSWLRERTVRGLQLTRPPETAARLPRELMVRWPGGSTTVEVGTDGRVDLPPVRTDQLTIVVTQAEPANSIDFDGVVSDVPVGIGELTVQGVPYFPLSGVDGEVDLPCGSGPRMTVRGVQVATKVLASRSDLQQGRVVRAEPCLDFPVALGEGSNDLLLEASEGFAPRSLVLRHGDDGSLGVASGLETRVPDATHRNIEPRAGLGVVQRENTNPGWEATQDGESLVPTVADGWRQAWEPVTGSETVAVRFAPDSFYRTGLVGGLAVLMLLIVGVGLPQRVRRRAAELPAVSERATGAAPLALLTVGAAGLLAGTTGAIVAVGAGLVALLLARLLPQAGAAAFAVCLAPAGLAYVVRPWGQADTWAGSLGWPSYFVLAAVAGVGVWMAASSRRRQRFFSRRPGISTTR